MPQRLINLLQTLVQAEVQRLPLREALYACEQVANAVFSKFAGSESLATLGIELLAISIQAIRPIPEMARALEAEAREELLHRADQAIYDRHNAAVEQERRIKENELNTEIAIEEKKRQIRETKVEADLAVEAKEQQVRRAKLNNEIALENERKQLVAARAENIREVYVKNAAGALLQQGVKELVMLHFPEGAFARTRRGEDVWQSAVKLPAKVVAGTAGAGDAFCAGALWGLHEGWELQRCLLTGVALAAASLTDPTCTAGIKSLAAAQALAKKHGFQAKLE